jgi:hypothetical protein
MKHHFVHHLEILVCIFLKKPSWDQSWSKSLDHPKQPIDLWEIVNDYSAMLPFGLFVIWQELIDTVLVFVPLYRQVNRSGISQLIWLRIHNWKVEQARLVTGSQTTHFWVRSEMSRHEDFSFPIYSWWNAVGREQTASYYHLICEIQ